MAEALECCSRGGVSQLGFVSERKQHFLALRRLPRPSNLEHGVDRQVRRFVLTGRLREGAVVADVATELRQRDEHLTRVGDDVAVRGIATSCGRLHEPIEVATLG